MIFKICSVKFMEHHLVKQHTNKQLSIAVFGFFFLCLKLGNPYLLFLSSNFISFWQIMILKIDIVIMCLGRSKPAALKSHCHAISDEDFVPKMFTNLPLMHQSKW